MGKPKFIEKLRHGRALCWKNFPKFVETFNWLVSSLLNLRGDGDNNENGAIKVNWDDVDRPVIRLDTNRLSLGGNGCFKIVGTDGTEATLGSGSDEAKSSLEFESAPDSNVSVSVAGDDNGNVTATIGVYWK